MNNKLLQSLGKEYGIEFNSFEKFGKSVNATYKLSSNDEEYFLKELYFFKNTKKEHYLAQIDIALHLEKKGISVMVPIQAKDGFYLVEVDNSFYLLYPFHKIDKPKNNDDRLSFAANFLADFHEAMNNFTTEHELAESSIENDIDSITLLTETPKSFHSDPLVVSMKKTKHPLRKSFAKEVPFLKSVAIRIMKKLWSLPFTEKSLLHYDFGPHNIFYSNDSFLAVSDFDFSHFGFVEVDVAKAAKFWSEEEDGTINLRKFKRFIYLYCKKRNMDIDWSVYYGLALFIVMRRLVYAVDYTFVRKDLQFLYDKDIKTLHFLMENDF